jgi:hypothetical protein
LRLLRASRGLNISSHRLLRQQLGMEE